METIRIYRFKTSPDYDTPECVCSFCLKGYEDEAEVDDEGVTHHDVPIRMFFNEGRGGECRFHTKCFEKLFTIVDGQITNKPGTQLDVVDEDHMYPIGPRCSDWEVCDHYSCLIVRMIDLFPED